MLLAATENHRNKYLFLKLLLKLMTGLLLLFLKEMFHL